MAGSRRRGLFFVAAAACGTLIGFGHTWYVDAHQTALDRWDGHSLLACGEAGERLEIRGRTFSQADGMALNARRCTMILTDCDVTGSPALYAQMSAKVFMVGGRYHGLVQVTDSAAVTLDHVELDGLLVDFHTTGTMHDSHVLGKVEAKDSTFTIVHSVLGGLLVNGAKVELEDSDIEGLPALQAWGSDLIMRSGRVRGTASLDARSSLDLDHVDVDDLLTEESTVTAHDGTVVDQVIVRESPHTSTLTRMKLGSIEAGDKGSIRVIDSASTGLVRTVGTGTIDGEGSTFTGPAEVSAAGRLTGAPAFEHLQGEARFRQALLAGGSFVCRDVEPCYDATGVIGNISGRLVVHFDAEGRPLKADFDKGDAPAATRACLVDRAMQWTPAAEAGAPGRASHFQCVYAGTFLGLGGSGKLQRDASGAWEP